MLAFVAWQAPQRSISIPGPSRATMTYILPPLQPQLPKPSISPAVPDKPRLPAAQRRLPAPDAAAASVTPAPAVTPQAITIPQAITPPPPPDPFAETPKPQEDLRQRALKSAGAIDQQLRKESWNPRDKQIADATSETARKLGRAFGPEQGVTQENMIMPDGRLKTRVRTPYGSSCGEMESNSVYGGRDPFRDGIKTKVTRC